MLTISPPGGRQRPPLLFSALHLSSVKLKKTPEKRSTKGRRHSVFGQVSASVSETKTRTTAHDEEIARVAPSLIVNGHTEPSAASVTAAPVTAAPVTMLTNSPPGGCQRPPLLFSALNLSSVKLKKTPKKESVKNSNPRLDKIRARRGAVASESDSDNSDNSGWESEEASPVVFARRPRVSTPSSRRTPMSLLAMINSSKSGLRRNPNNVNICKK